MRIGVATSIATAIAIGAIVIVGGGGGGVLANIWVDSNGGTCFRSATQVAYVDAAACATFDAAYQAATPGDTINVKCGSYPSQTVLTNATFTAAGSSATIQPENSTTGCITVTGDVVFGVSTGDGPDHLTVKNVVCSGNDTDTTIWDASQYVTLDGWDCSSFDIFSTSNVTISNGDWGPCLASGSAKCLNRVALSGVGQCCITITGNTIHDITCATLANCDAHHVDGIAVFGSDQLTISKNKFYHNEITNIRLQNNVSSGRANTNLVLENNWFNYACAATTPTCSGGLNSNAVDVDSSAACLRVAFNSFAETTFMSQSTGLPYGTAGCFADFVGNNISVTNNCGSNVTYEYNASQPWSAFQGQTPCGANDVKVSSFGYSNIGIDGAFDFHIGAGSSSNNITPTSVTGGCAATDIDGTARPIGALCDAGSDER